MFIPRLYIPTNPGDKAPDPQPIEDFFAAHVVVVLGDPGQGKTEAFKQAAQDEADAVFVPLRQFLHRNVERWRGKVLYLDGLDEQRAKLKGRDVLGEIVERLDQLDCPKVRLSCRTPDWHGGSDVSILSDLAPEGTVCQLMLLPIAPGGIRAIIQDAGLDADSFLEEAEQRDIAPLFGNPQLLALFIETVGGGRGWPATRKELMETAIARMMEEANDDHERATIEQLPGGARLSEAADRIAALILLSGQEGVALGPAGREGGFVDLSAIAGEWADAMRVAGRRRAFHADAPEQASPRHRTLAEFMAARHLAHLVQDGGLPLRRVLTLLTGADGGTLSDLRGLYAWLVSFVPAHADLLLERDPLGAIHYGDAASWPVPVRRQALAALQKQEHIDPYYRAQLWSRAPLAGLAHPALAEDFRAILAGPDGTTLGIALDALARGTPLPALADDLMAVIRDETRAPHSRKAAIAAFANADASRLRELVSVLDDLNAGKLSDEHHELRQTLIQHLYPTGLSVQELARYLAPCGREDKDFDTDLVYDNFGIRIGHVVVNATADAGLPALADALNEAFLSPKKRHLNWWHYLLTALYRRMIASGAFDTDPARLDRWLRLSEDEYGHACLDKDGRNLLGDFFAAQPERFNNLVLAWLTDAPDDPQEWWWAWGLLRERTALPSLPSHFGHFLLDLLATGATVRHEERLLRLATIVLMEADQPATGQPLDILFAFVAEHPRFEIALAETVCCDIPDWRMKQAESRKKHTDSREKGCEARRKYLSQNAEAIRTGRHLHELDWGARFWFGNFSDVDRDAARQRLVTEVGEEFAELYIEGFVAVRDRDDLPDLAEHLRLNSEQKRHLTAFPLLAGLDYQGGISCDALHHIPDGALHSALAAHFVVYHGKDRSWPDVLIDQRPDLSQPILSAWWRHQLDQGRWPEGLYLLTKEDTPLTRSLRAHALELLTYKPGADAEILHPLLKVCAKDQPAALLELAHTVLTRPPPLEDNAAVTWASRMATLAPETFGPILEHRATASEDGWWSLRFAAESLSGQWPLSLQAEVLRWLLPGLAPVPGTIGVSSVGRNDREEASRALDALIDRLAKRTEPEAGAALTALRDNPACAAWRKALAHAVCVQAQVRRDAQFDYATLEQVVEVLDNGPPASLRDLQALVLDHLDGLAVQLRKGDADGWRQLWNTASSKTTTPKAENDGRDVLLPLLRLSLAPKGVSVEREGDFAAHKRADIVIRHHLSKLPIEIKRNFHADVWKAMDWQLAGQYAADPECQGYGIYLVLWFGPVKGFSMPTPPGGPARPKTPQEMQATLRLLADQAGLGNAIAIRVIDCGTAGG